MYIKQDICIDKQRALDALITEMSTCRKCDLCNTRTHVVHGAGLPEIDVLIIGEAPGKNEDEAGVPFVGAAGKRLDAYLAEAGIVRDKVYIANILKCRPPENRDPRPAEIEVCAPYLQEQIRILDPRCIVTLGNFATKYMLQTKQGIRELRGTQQTVDGRVVFPVFHPAAAIYDRKKIDDIRHDFAQIAAYVQKEGLMGS